jgi:hypothetical protein
MALVRQLTKFNLLFLIAAAPLTLRDGAGTTQLC